MAMELARDLKVAGLPWRPRRGDLTMDRLNDLFVVLEDGSDDVEGSPSTPGPAPSAGTT